jgi:hypothetical protein
MSYEPHQQTPLAPKHYFDDNSQRYRLCCCHVRTWALVIGILELISLVFQLIGNIVNYAMGNGRGSFGYGGNTLGALIGSIIFFIIFLACVILLLVGLKKENHWMLIPHLILQVNEHFSYNNQRTPISWFTADLFL